ncbi:MAG: aldehyde reductase [Pseudomonadota bacterium]
MTKVFVTGASGFIAKHIVKDLLAAGYEVRASIRSEQRKAELDALFPDAALEFAILDLTSDEGWDAALQGCDVLMHTASPFPMSDPKDPQELIRPAVDGTLRALNAALKAGIKRVILTSSNAAIYKDASKPKEAPSDETHWTTADAPFVTAYEASKTLAERAAWDFVAQHPEIALTTVNPGAVFGPALDSRYGTSLELVERLMSGKDPMIPPMSLPMVDVRDVSMMHVRALELEATKGERFAATAETMRFAEAVKVLAAWDPALKMAKREAPVWLLRVFALFMPEAKAVIVSLGRNLSVSGAKAERVYGFTFIPASDALVSSAETVRKFSS